MEQCYHPLCANQKQQVQSQYELLFKEKSEQQLQLNIEIQRRLLLEKDVNEMHRQIESLKCGPQGVSELLK